MLLHHSHQTRPQGNATRAVPAIGIRGCCSVESFPISRDFIKKGEKALCVTDTFRLSSESAWHSRESKRRDETSGNNWIVVRVQFVKHYSIFDFDIAE